MAFSRGLLAVGLFCDIEIRDFLSGEKVRRWKGHERRAVSLIFTSEGNLVSVSNDALMKKWDVETGRALWSREVDRAAIVVTELADGRLVVGGTDGFLQVFDGVTGNAVVACRGHSGWLSAVVCLGDSFASTAGKNIRVWARDGTQERVMEAGTRIWSLALSPCGSFVAAGCEAGAVMLFQLPDWDQVWSVKAHGGMDVVSVHVSPDGRYVASGSWDRAVAILTADTGAIVSKFLRGHKNHVVSVFFSPDGATVVSGSKDRTVRVWRIFWPAERRTRALCAGLVVDERTDFERDGLREVVRRMKRLWEVEDAKR
jgi:WD40 repeat protein